MNIGLIGAGAIGTYLLDELNERNHQNFHITSVYVRDKEKYKHLEQKYNVKLFTELKTFIESEIDIVVEAANIETTRELLPLIIKKKEAVLISIGALGDTQFLDEIQSLTNIYGTKVHVPSGAIGGLDLVQNVSAVGVIDEVKLVTRKPAHTLVSKQIEKEKVIFDGSAVDAINKYPRNMNVSIALALAGVGFDQTKVTLIADPHVKENIHKVEVRGEFGSSICEFKNNQLPSNPNTSYLAAVSIIGTLHKMTQNIRIS